MKKPLTTLALGGVALLLAAGPAAADHEGTSYSGTLSAMNGSGGSGETTITVSDDGETMSVELDAAGLNLDAPHAMHVHGILEGDEVMASACPTDEADADGDGVVDVAEGVPFYGGIQVSLTTEGDTTPDSGLAVDRYPAGTSIDYARAGIPIPDAVKPAIDKLHVVVHGLDENGNGTLDMDQEIRSSLTDDLPREATAPALCGELTAMATGPVQTGGGGTAGDLDATALGALGLFGLAGAGLFLRRRAGEAA